MADQFVGDEAGVIGRRRPPDGVQARHVEYWDLVVPVQGCALKIAGEHEDHLVASSPKRREAILEDGSEGDICEAAPELLAELALDRLLGELSEFKGTAQR